MRNLTDTLQRYWGFSTFRPLQEDIITSVLNGRDTVALLPTGGGKSLCYQLPGIVLDGICIVISPLIALMDDQVAALNEKGIKAIKLTGGIPTHELTALLDNACYGNYKFLYLSPERLQQELVQNYIKRMPVNLIAVDEAHCISQWGNDFRPAYRNITPIRELHPLVPMIALTATATPEVLTDTVSELRMEEPAIFQKSFIRDNLSYQVFKEDDKLYKAEQLLKKNTGAAIVYVRNRQGTVEICNHLNSIGIPSVFYHGGLSAKEKKKRLELWRSNQVSTVVATNAFGMGIDHPNVRYVIHLQIPESIESYFQEAGRAGRDGNFSSAVLLYNSADIISVKNQYIKTIPNIAQVKEVYRRLNSYFQIAYSEGEYTQHDFDFLKFCQSYKFNATLTYNVLKLLDQLAVIQLSEEFGEKTIVRFLIPSNQLLQYFSKDLKLSLIGKTILRMYGGIFNHPTAINLELIQSKTGQSQPTIVEALHKMEADNVIELKLFTTDASLTFLVPREDERTINVISREIKHRGRKKYEQVQAMLRYVANNDVCRSVQLVTYFGERKAKPCGICSVCRQEPNKISRKELEQLAQKVIMLLKDGPRSSRAISEILDLTETQVLAAIRLLLDNEYIKLNIRNQYYIPE